MSSSFKSLSPQLIWDKNGLPASTAFDDIYYSSADARDESRHVFLQGTELTAAWSQAGQHHGQFTVCELGFGGGLNFLMTWELWNNPKHITQRHSSQRQLHYIAIEKYPITATQLQQLHSHWPELATYSTQLMQHYRSDYRGLQRIKLTEDLTLDLVTDDAQQWLSRRSLANPGIDAWYLDGFSPSKNPQLWCAELCQLLAQHSSAQCRLATYSSAGKVRRNLAGAGFDVNRQPGFANKRHMLIACGVNASKANSSAVKPWFRFPANPVKPEETASKTKTETPRTAMVIGAGLAGCSTAHALAQRGWLVTVLDKAENRASAASAISQLALRCRLFNAASSQSHFFAQAYLYATGYLKNLNSAEKVIFHDCGLLQKADAINSGSGIRADRVSRIYPRSIVYCDDQGDFRFAEGGWVNPAEVCEALLDHPAITFVGNKEVHDLRRQGGAWQAFGKNQSLLAKARVAIVANAHLATELSQCSQLPLTTSHGQSSEFAANSIPVDVDTVVCGEKSVFPAHAGKHTVSASYRSGADTGKMRAEDDVANQRALEELLQLPQATARLINSQIATRCNTRDRFPAVGPMPDHAANAEIFAELSRNAKANPTGAVEHLGGLYINIGHGSNGLASCPISAEYLASLISGENSPLDQEMMNALNPVRFQIQDMKKQRY